MPSNPSETDLLAQIGRRLESARKHAGMTQKQASESVGASLRALQSWENGERSAPVTAIVAMVAAYQCSADWLLGSEAPFRALIDPEVERRAMEAPDLDQHTEYAQLMAVLVSERLEPITSQRELTRRLERVAARGDELREGRHGNS